MFFTQYITFILSMLFADAGDTATISIPEPAPIAIEQIAAKPEVKKRPVRKPVKVTPKVTPKQLAPVSAASTPAQLLPAKVANTQVAAAPTAEEAVKKVQAFYNSTKSFTASFTQTVTNQTFNRRKPKVSPGKVYILKPGKMRFDYENPAKKGSVSKSFISDGKSLWAVMHNNKQYYKSSLSNSALPTAVSFLMGTGDLLTDFNVSFDTAGKYGSKSDVLLLLIPKSPSARYKKLWLVIDKSNYSVKESIVLNSKNDTNSIRFRAVKINSGNLKPSHFIFNARAFSNYRLITPPKSKP